MPTPTPCHLQEGVKWGGASGTQAVLQHRGGQCSELVGATAVELQRARASLSA